MPWKIGETVVTREPVLVVEADMPPGRYRVQLVVEDDDEQASLPDEIRIAILNAPS